jgi:hypothetical protein
MTPLSDQLPFLPAPAWWTLAARILASSSALRAASTFGDRLGCLKRLLSSAAPAIAAVAEDLLAVETLSRPEVVHLIEDHLPADSWLWVTSHLKDYAQARRQGESARRR